MRFLLILLVIFWLSYPLGQFGRLGSFGVVNLYLVDFLAGLVFLFTIPMLGRLAKTELKPIFKAWLALAGIWLVSLVVSPLRLEGAQELVAGLYLLRWVVGSGLVFTGYLVAKAEGKGLLGLMLVGGLGLAVSGLVQYAVFPYLGPITPEGWDPHLYRVVSSFLDPGFSGFIYVASIVLLWACRGLLRLSRASWAALMGIFYLSLALTYSRASYLAFVASLGMLAVKNRAYRWYGKVLVVFVLTLLLLPRPEGEGVRLERENSLKARIENWSHALSIASRHPVLGVGFNAYRYAQEKAGFVTVEEQNHAAFGSDSSLLLVLATSGVVGLGVFGWFVFEIVRQLVRVKSALSLASRVTLAGLFIHSFFLNSVFYPWILGWVALAIGVTLGSRAKARR